MASMRIICVLATLVAMVYGQCNLQANTDFTGTNSNNPNEGSITTLSNVPSASDCCTACAGFQECEFFSYVSSSSASDYQKCYLKTSVVKAISSSTRTGGFMARTPANKLGQSCGATTANTDYDNGFLGNGIYNVPNVQACCNYCQNYTGCNYYVYASSNQACYLKGNNASPKANNGVTAGSVVQYPTVTKRTGKRGLGLFDTVSCSDIALYTSISWMYGWNAQPAPEILQCLINYGIEYVPMQWGATMALSTMYTQSTHILGFNEPNFNQQSNILPAKAASLWPQIQQWAQANNMKTVSPSASAGGDNYDPIKWMTEFLGNCSGCQVDAIATHIYSCYPAGVKGFADQFKRFNRPIWLTEFACTDGELQGILGRTPTASDYADYITKTVTLLENDASYERYAYFGTRTSVGSLSPTLSSTRAQLNVQGQAYVNFNSPTSTPTSAPATKAPTSAPTTGTPTTAPPKTVYPIYLGCYVDGSNRDLAYQVTTINANVMTVELCEAACLSQKYAYAGLQYGSECRCSNTYGKLGKAPATDCSMTCNGNKTELCGAGWRNNIYQVADAPSKAITDNTGNNANREVTSLFVVLCAVVLSMMMM